MAADLTKPDRRQQKYPLTPPSWLRCVACGEYARPGEMGTVTGRPADLGAMLSGAWMCLDAEKCHAQHTARSKGSPTVFAVVQTDAEWASGTAMLYTRDPRKAHAHAAQMRACVVHLRIDIDYEQGGTR